MKSWLGAFAALACAMPVPAAGQSADSEVARAEQYRDAMQSARWTGPLLAANAETLPRGHFYTEPYLYDVISGGDHYPGSSGFYQYGLTNSLTVGLQPSFAFGARGPKNDFALGDFKLLSQLRLTHFTPEHRVPTIAVVVNQFLPTGKHDELDIGENGHGSGASETEVGLNVQHYFLTGNERLLRARLNVLKTIPHRAELDGRSVYGTGAGFRGHADRGSRTTVIAAIEYSLTREWVLAFDMVREWRNETDVEGRYGSGPITRQTIPSTRSFGFAPAIEYNWSDRSGVILGVWITPDGHNVGRSVIPAIAYSRFW